MPFLYVGLLILCLIPLPAFGQNPAAKTQLEWEEWEKLFEPLEKAGLQGGKMMVGWIGGVELIQCSMKRQQAYFGEYAGEGWESGPFLSVSLARHLDIRFALLLAHYHFTGFRRFEQEDHTFDIRMDLFRLPVMAVYTIPTPIIQPQVYLGFNMGNLFHSEGHPFFQKDAQAKNYWTSTITSGLDAGVLLRYELGDRYQLHAGGGINLVVLNPFDQIRSKQLQIGLGYRL